MAPYETKALVGNLRMRETYKSISLSIFVILVIIVYLAISKKESLTSVKLNRLYKERTNFEIFFIESNMKRSEIDTKQMCAIESAAKNNPNEIVKIFSLKSQLNKNSSFLLKKYDNIQFVNFDPEKMLNDTRLLEFWNKGEVMRSAYGHAHLSDFLR